MISAQMLRVCREGKPVATIPDHALADAGEVMSESVKMPNTRTEQMFSASPPTTDMQWLHRNDRFVPKPEVARLFDHLIGTAEQRLGNCKAEHLGRPEIYDHLDFRGTLDGKVGGFLALENPSGVDAD
jgi:hypothetical protein